MIKIVGDNLEDVYEQASAKLECSIENIHIDIVQYPRNIFGIIKKKAIVIANKKNDNESIEHEPKEDSTLNTPIQSSVAEIAKQEEEYEQEEQEQKEIFDIADAKSTSDILDSFNAQDSKTQEEQTILEIRSLVQDVFCLECLEVTLDEVSFFNNKTIYIQFSGKDSSLMIGKNGFRYKALSYLIFSWIFSKYNLYVKLEIGEFLFNQSEMIKRHLKKFITQVDDFGYATTDNLDGVLLHLAVEHLREKFPNKMVIIKENTDSTRYIKVCDFK